MKLPAAGPGERGKADLHIHTNAGDGLDTLNDILDHVEVQTNLDVIAITEHDNLDVALEARERWARASYRFDFIPGCEVTTLEGHLVALYLERPVESLRRVEKTIDAIHRQGGVCFIPHPASWLTRSIGPGTLARVNQQRDRGTWFDAIETANAGPAGRFYLGKARRLAYEFGLPGVGSSDAHFVQAIGTAYTEFEGTTAADLRQSFSEQALCPHQMAYPSLRKVGLARSLSLPFVGLRATPRALGWRRTTWSFVSRYFPS
jgi:predicted metal-dependent phosphoesterase TrpH